MSVPKKLDRARLKELAKASQSWPPYLLAPLGVLAPTKIEIQWCSKKEGAKG